MSFSNFNFLQSIRGFKRLVHYYGFKNSLYFSYTRYLSLLQEKFLDISKSHTIPVHSYQLTTMPNDHGISSELILYGVHELTTTEIFYHELKSGMVCLDIGSNIGYFALLERQLVGETGQVICIEPSPLIFNILEKNIKLQNFKNMKFYNFACGDENQTMPFATSMSSNQSGIIDDNSSLLNSSLIEKNYVKVIKVDNFIDDNSFSKIDFIRFDTEGYEEKIISGMTETIKKFHPILSFEMHRTVLGNEKTIKLLKTIENFGYELKYCISGINCAKIGGLKSAKKFTISELIKKINNDTVPGGFGVYFEFKDEINQ